MSKLKQNLYKVIAHVFNIDLLDVNSSRGPHDILGWDSLGQLNLILQIENEFNVKFDIEDVFSFFTVDDIYNSLSKKLDIDNDDDDV